MDIDQAPQRLRVLPSWLLAQSAILAQRTVAAHLSDAGVSRSHYALLSCLEEFAPLSQAELGTRTGLDRADVVRFIDDMAGSGLILRTADPLDRRRNVITLTEQGSRTLSELDAVIARAQIAALGHLSAEEQSQLISLLQRLLEHPQPATDRVK